MAIEIDRIDHFVITAADLEASLDFYVRVLGMRPLLKEDRPAALHFGNQKMHVHQAGKEFSPRALKPTPGAADICFITEQDIAQVVAHLESQGVAIEVGPATREGATGLMTSVYFRDPDRNLVEVSQYHAP